jgi:hypothetical protein
MKFLFSFLFLLLSVSSFAGTLTFRRDDRPKDGMLKELTITGLEVRDGSRVKLRSVWNNQMSSGSNEKVDLTESFMDCLQATNGGKLESLNCIRDDRPRDGAKVVVVVKRNSHSTFDVLRETTVASRMTGKESTKVETLATDLTQN